MTRVNARRNIDIRSFITTAGLNNDKGYYHGKM